MLVLSSAFLNFCGCGNCIDWLRIHRQHGSGDRGGGGERHDIRHIYQLVQDMAITIIHLKSQTRYFNKYAFVHYLAVDLGGIHL